MKHFEKPASNAGVHEGQEGRENRIKAVRPVIAGIVAVLAAAARGETGISVLDKFLGPKTLEGSAPPRTTASGLESRVAAIYEQAEQIYHATKPIDHALRSDWEKFFEKDNPVKWELVGRIGPHVVDAAQGLDRGAERATPHVARLADWLESLRGGKQRSKSE